VSPDRDAGITRRQLVVGLSASALFLIASGCVPRPPLAPAGVPSLEELAGSEIRVYQGQELDSITATQENSIKGPQYIDKKSWALTVDGLVDSAKTYTFSQLLGAFTSEKQVHRLDCVEGWGETQLWEGIRILDVIAASVPEASATTVILHATDGYTTSFPLDYFKPEHLLVHRINEVDLPAERGGPLRLGAWSKWGYKWIRWIERIELSDDPDYRGYWESRGYSNEGERSETP
jgi:DMSO/TMAO reductase YedYZ molybdopterin-dependent catalytic subunit